MDFIRNALAANCRLDGRRLDDQPRILLEPNVSAVAHGSCRVTLDDTLVITTVTFSVTAPEMDRPDEGNIEITLGSPFTLEDQEISQKRDERMAHILELLLFQKQNFDRRLLCILPGQFVWTMRVHTTVLQRGGAVPDAISIAIIGALRTVSIPNLQVMVRDELEGSRTGRNIRVRLSEGCNLNIEKLAMQIPVCVTVARIGDCHVWSVNQEEAACADGYLMVAVAPDGSCAGMRAVGTAFSLSALPPLIEKARQIGLYQHQQIVQSF
ncbi:exosome complex component protein [Babesia ovis]|uniref:Ribosomal RNA-processing protein 42 n=1 Tax=Babesia ovis TaxID=5869 RepID=A0A9W5TC87_BABOV|nr:exosome complex component protein [Babesia ovis]